MDVFALRDRLTEDYAAYASSFIQIRDQRIYEEVHRSLNAGVFWPDPLIQLNPSFASGGTVQELVAEGVLHRECSRIFLKNKKAGDATSVLHSPDADPAHLYDAIIVDEGQDFEDTWWIGLLDTLKSAESSVFYVFFDDNQRIFTQISQVPMDNAPLYLDENLRNTRHIHERLKPYSRDTDVQCVGPEGRPVKIIPASDKSAERRELQRVLHRLVNEEGIPAEHIVVLTPAGEKRSQWKKDDQLGNFIITWQLDTEMQMAARVSTIHSYKGLESPVVVLTELHALHPATRDQLLYVGLSRARHHVVVIGDLPAVANTITPKVSD